MDTKRILVIDDEATIREIVQLCLTQLGGWQVLTASSIPEGLLLAQNEHLDVIVLDLLLPHISGIAFLEMRKTCPQLQAIPVIILSGSSLLVHPNHLEDLNVAKTIAKPFEPKNLVQQVAQVLNEPTVS